MARLQTETTARESLRTLSKEEIELRIERVLAEVALADGLFDADPGGDAMRPRWISTAEYPRRNRQIHSRQNQGSLNRREQQRRYQCLLESGAAGNWLHPSNLAVK